MGWILLMSLSITLGFAMGAYWYQSGDDAPVTRELYNKIMIASMTWWTTAYSLLKKYMSSDDDEENVSEDIEEDTDS